MNSPASATAPAVNKEPSGTRLALTLAVAGFISGLAIVVVYEFTQPMIQANQAAELKRAVLEVVPTASQIQALWWNDQTQQLTTENPDDSLATAFGAYDAEGNFVGYGLVGKAAGFQDIILLIYGYNPKTQRIVGMRVLDSKETPGLGDKIIKDMKFVGSFDNLACDPEIIMTKPGKASADNEVDAITGATISARAVIKIVNATHARWRKQLPAAGKEPPLANKENSAPTQEQQSEESPR